jgi:hypothetical protein
MVVAGISGNGGYLHDFFIVEVILQVLDLFFISG